ncbi:antibiotic biosynthesis monooxygenase [Kitasatospora sp. NPDC087314]|uniref:antibiotic biosynthesis monooxygenase n=1 Tax=Kitasatospora sp. NPDC087314 TaxID=3364068 RepID=UPI0038111540
MTSSTSTYPELTRPDAGTILVSEWLVGTPERQRAVIRATLDAWRNLPVPEAFLSLNAYAGTDGDSVLFYAQWTSDEAHLEFARAHRPGLVRAIDDELPGIERPGLVRYRLYRSGGIGGGEHRAPGCIVAVSIGADGPDRARAWVDTVFDALEESGERLHPGGISGHFHISTDGTRILNYAEWVDEESHRESVAAGGGSIGRGPAWDRVRNTPGIEPLGLRRYTFEGSVTRGSRPADRP